MSEQEKNIHESTEPRGVSFAFNGHRTKPQEILEYIHDLAEEIIWDVTDIVHALRSRKHE